MKTQRIVSRMSAEIMRTDVMKVARIDAAEAKAKRVSILKIPSTSLHEDKSHQSAWYRVLLQSSSLRVGCVISIILSRNGSYYTSIFTKSLRGAFDVGAKPVPF